MQWKAIARPAEQALHWREDGALGEVGALRALVRGLVLSEVKVDQPGPYMRQPFYCSHIEVSRSDLASKKKGFCE